MEERKTNFNGKMASLFADSSAQRGTIGVVALDQQGDIAAGTSTGGRD
jgi:L-asparaginase